MDDFETATVTRSVDLDATPERVWDALVDDDQRSAWLGRRSRIDVRRGGPGKVTDDDGTVRHLAVEDVQPGRRLAWRWWPEQTGNCSTVEFVLEPVGPGTRLIVTERAAPGTTVAACRSAAGSGVSSALVCDRLTMLARVVGAAVVVV